MFSALFLKHLCKNYTTENTETQIRVKYAFWGMLICFFFVLLGLTTHLLCTPVFHLIFGDALALSICLIAIGTLYSGGLKYVPLVFVGGLFVFIFVQTIMADLLFNDLTTSHFFHLFQTSTLSLIGIMFLAAVTTQQYHIYIATSLSIGFIAFHAYVFTWMPGFQWHFGVSMVVIVACLEVLLGSAAAIIVYNFFYEIIALSITRNAFIVKQKRELEGYAQKLQKTNDDLELFASAISHDLKEPLRTIASYTQLLQREVHKPSPDSERVNEFVDFAVDGSLRMRKMIDSLLNYARIRVHEMDKKEVKLADILQTVECNLSVLINEKNASIVKRNQMLKVKGEQQLLVQLFQNFFTNALKYSRTNQDPIVYIDCEKQNNKILIKIQDNGQGIAEEDLDRIFRLFQRGKYNHNQQVQGTGIGLAFCKRIVEQHDGTIQVQSKENVGSIFAFDLPLAN